MSTSARLFVERTQANSVAAPLVASWLIADLPAEHATVAVSSHSSIIIDLLAPAPNSTRAAVMTLLEQSRFAGWVVVHQAP